MAKKKSSRRMPPHIVLPNGMWRFVKRGTKTSTRTTRAKRGAKVRTIAIRKAPKRSGFMASKKVRTRSRSTRGSLMTGIIPVRGFAAKALLGVGAVMLANRFLPAVVPQQSLVVGGLVGGLPGAAAAFILQGGALSGGANGITFF